MQGFIYFTERWLYSTNHKYMVRYTYYLVWCGLVRVVIISDDAHRASGCGDLIINLIINYTIHCDGACLIMIFFFVMQP